MLKKYSAVGFIVILFIVSTYFSAKYEVQLQNLIDQSFLGVLLYILIISVSTVVAPVSNLPLIPIASNIWGPVLSGILSIIGWFIGSLLIFWLCRKYGLKILEKVGPRLRSEKYTHILPGDQMFWSHILLRMMIPVDILSYLLGLFSTIHWKMFALTTFIGITPMAFVFAFGGVLSVGTQVTLFIAGAIILTLIYRYRLKI